MSVRVLQILSLRRTIRLLLLLITLRLAVVLSVASARRSTVASVVGRRSIRLRHSIALLLLLRLPI